MGTARWVSTIADLQAEMGMSNGEAAIVSGYFAAGDGGGGIFYFDDTMVPNSATITGATNASPIVIATATAHGLASGQRVVIAGVGGNTAANGSWRIIVTSTTQFQLQGSTGNGNYTSGGAVGNGGTTVPSSAVALRFWRRLHSGEFNVKWFGAKSDGVTANEAPIQAVVTELSSAGGVMYFPPGMFGISENILIDSVPPSAIRGAGRELSIIKDLRTDVPTGECAAGSACGILSFLNAPKCEVKDITLEGVAGFGNTPSLKRKGIYATTGSSLLSVRNVVTRKIQGEAIYADSSERIRFIGNYVVDCATNGLNVNGSPTTDAGCNVSDNVAEKVSGSGVQVAARTTVVAGNLNRQPIAQGADVIFVDVTDTFVLVDNVVNEADCGIAAVAPIHIGNTQPGVVPATYGLASGNVVTRNITVNVNSAGPIRVANTPGEILVAANLITENGRSTDGPSPGIDLSGASIGRVVVVSNQISKGSANNQDKGIRIISSVPTTNKLRVGINFISVATPYDFQTAPAFLIGEA